MNLITIICKDISKHLDKFHYEMKQTTTYGINHKGNLFQIDLVRMHANCFYPVCKFMKYAWNIKQLGIICEYNERGLNDTGWWYMDINVNNI